MSRLPMKGDAAVLPPASLSVQLAELRREKKMRAGVYQHWIETGKIKRDVAAYQTNALDGAIATLERLVDAQNRGEPGRKELIEALRTARRRLEEIGSDVAWLDELLTKVTP